MKSLFRSQTSFTLLNFFTLNKGKSFTLTELTSALDKDPANTSRELAKLQDDGLVRLETDHGKKVYQWNEQFPAAQEFNALFSKLRHIDFDRRLTGTWLLGEDIPTMDPFFSKIWLDSFVDEFGYPSGRTYKKIAAVYRDYHLWFYFDEADALDVAEHIVDRMVMDPSFMEEINRQIIFHSDRLRSYTEKLPENDLERLPNTELWNLYNTHDEIHTAYYQWGWIPVAADMFTNSLTERGKKILRGYGVPEEKVNGYLTQLTQPLRPSLLKVQQDALAQIGILIQQDPAQMELCRTLFKKFKEEDVKLFTLYEHSPQYEAKFEEVVRELVQKIRPDILAKVQQHYTTYFYTKFLFTEEQGVYGFEYFLKELVRLVNSDTDIAATLRKEEEETKRMRVERQALITALQLPSDVVRMFDAWGDFMVTKIYRRFAQIFALYRMVPVIEEIGRRIGLTLKETKFMTIAEVKSALLENTIRVEEIKSRVSFSVYYADKDEHVFFTGADAERAVQAIQREVVHHSSEIRGQCGCQGSARGAVRIVNRVEDMNKVKPGDILVSIATQPDLVPAMKKAAAFVTDQGGVTSHAAIVAREMNKPCVIGTKIATHVLRDGMVIEVDATRGVVRIVE